MAGSEEKLLSVVVPLYNESSGLEAFHKSLVGVLEDLPNKTWEIIYVDDGSSDGTAELVTNWHKTSPKVKLVSLSRNFGKENALTAGINEAGGAAIIMIDGDGQHPVELLPQFIESWRSGSKVVVGIRQKSKHQSLIKRVASKSFYKFFNRLARQKLVPYSTDFRLIDRSVRQAFLSLKETDRLTRGLIDWLGFETNYIEFSPKARGRGLPGYRYNALFKLATNSVISFSPLPLYIFGVLGVFITFGALVLGFLVVIEQLLLNDPWHWKFTGTAMLGILILFLVGIVLMSQGILSLYISHIHNQSKRRPLYIIDYEKSAGITQT